MWLSLRTAHRSQTSIVPTVRYYARNTLSRCRRRPWLALSLSLSISFALIICSSLTWLSFHTRHYRWHTKHNYLMLHTAPLLHKFVRLWTPFGENGDLGPPRHVPELLEAEWPGIWEVPIIRSPSTDIQIHDQDLPLTGFWLSLHIFSTSTPESRARRALIRRHHHPLDSLPHDLRKLVSVKFVLGHPDPDGSETELTARQVEEVAIRAEGDAHQDLVRLPGLLDGDNMNKGKSWEWAKWAGREENAAQWVSKCDDDTYVLLPNLLDLLLTLDPSQPTYVGASTGHWPGFLWYYGGMLYGFSWGVVRTIATSNVKTDFYTNEWHEDVVMGEMMYNLPSMPICDTNHTAGTISKFALQASQLFGLDLFSSSNLKCQPFPIKWNTPPAGGWNSPPASPDPRSGLVRVDLEGRLGAPWDQWVHGPDTAIAWHPVKDNQSYIASYERARDHFIDMNGKYGWAPQKGWENKLQWSPAV